MSPNVAQQSSNTNKENEITASRLQIVLTHFGIQTVMNLILILSWSACLAFKYILVKWTEGNLVKIKNVLLLSQNAKESSDKCDFSRLDRYCWFWERLIIFGPLRKTSCRPKETRLEPASLASSWQNPDRTLSGVAECERRRSLTAIRTIEWGGGGAGEKWNPVLVFHSTQSTCLLPGTSRGQTKS